VSAAGSTAFPHMGSVQAFNVFIDSAGVKLGSGLCWLVVIVTFFAGLSRSGARQYLSLSVFVCICVRVSRRSI